MAKKESSSKLSNWKCPNCGATNNVNKCIYCGTVKYIAHEFNSKKKKNKIVPFIIEVIVWVVVINIIIWILKWAL